MKIMTLKKTVAELEGKNFAMWCTSHWYCLLLTRFSVKVNNMRAKMFLAHFTTGSGKKLSYVSACLLAQNRSLQKKLIRIENTRYENSSVSISVFVEINF